MRTRIGKLLHIVVLLVAGIAHAHEGHAHRVMGTVTAVSIEQVTLQTTEGKSVSVLLDAGTKYRKGDDPGAAGDLKVSDRVVIDATGKDRLTAKTIHLSAGVDKRPHAAPRLPKAASLTDPQRLPPER